MKKCTAIIFLLLICLTNFSGKLYACDATYEWFADSDEPESEKKEAKKEVKEFTANAHKKLAVLLLLQWSYNLCGPFTLPKPALDKLSPPPDPSC